MFGLYFGAMVEKADGWEIAVTRDVKKNDTQRRRRPYWAVC